MQNLNKEAELRTLVAEMQARQAELESQNEALRQTCAGLEAELEQAVFRRIFRDNPLGAALLNLDLEFIEINAQLERMLGYSLEELRSLNQERFRRTLAAGLTQDRSTILAEEQLCPTKSGAEIWALVMVSAICEADGSCACLLVTFNDITARKQAEAELRESEERYRNLFEAESDAIFLIDNASGCILEANSAAAAMYGFSRAELLAKKNHELSAEPEDTQQVTHGTPIIADKIINIPLRYHRKADGTVFPVEITGRFFERHGRDVHLAAIRDITARKQAEDEKACLEEQYRQAHKMESIGRLAGGVAHDLNNMLTPILGYSTLLLNDSLLDRSLRRPVENIIHAGTRARDLVQQLLAFSRKQILEFRSIDLNSELKSIHNLLRRTVREDICLRFQPAAGSLFIRGDLGQLEQMLMNLAVNAQDAMPEGGTLTFATSTAVLDDLGTVQDLKPGNYALLTVTDTGHGMDAATSAQIFEPFFTTKSIGKGTGLGLSMVYGTVRQHGGSIAVDSAPGRGSTFKIYLPLGAVPEPLLAVEPPKPEPSSGPVAATVLLVEDDEMARDLVETILSMQGYAVLTAENGLVALDVLEAYDQPVDLLLTDVIMPEMNGKQLYARVIEQYPGIKVLFMSGYPASVITNRGVLADSLNFIQKPFTVEALVAKLQAVLVNQ